MAKKIFDILPPKIVHKIEEKRTKGRQNRKYYKNRRSGKERYFFPKEVLVGFAVLFLILTGILYFKLQRADIEIWPKIEVLSFQEQVMADNSADTINLDSKTIPAQYFEEEKDLWQEFLATGNASNDGKAEGIIVIYNNYSPAGAVTLKTGTHFLSDSGKYFVTLQKVTIPAAKKENNKNVPGSVEIKVQATESGEDYNIKPAKFSVPKLVGTSYYYSIYAQSSRSMAGGFSSEMKKVTEDDITTAKSTLTKKLLDDTQKTLKSKISADYVLLDNAVLAEIIESSAAVRAGTVVDKFNYQARVKATALVFKKSDLESFIKEYISFNISDLKTFSEDSLSLSYNPETIDIKDGKTVLNLDFSVETYQTIDKNDLASLFREKSAGAIKEVIDSRMGDSVSQIQVNLWPFWTTKAPRDKNKIKVDLKFK